MSFVLDTSVTMAWCFEDEATATTDALLRDLTDDATIVVPSWWSLEVANVLVEAERRKRLTEAQSARFVGLLTQLPIETDRHQPPIQTVVDVARRWSLTSHDAAYLQLAERRGLPLATLDDRLSRAAAEAGVALALR